MNGIDLPVVDSIKILGLTLDRKLNYLQHIKEVTNKAINLYRGATRTARAHWGLNPEVLKTIYISVVEPTILYAANVWAKKSQTIQIRNHLDRITRLFGIMICKGHKTISMPASTVLSGIIPLDLRALERRELYQVKRGKPLEQLPGRESEKLVTPYTLPHPARRSEIPFDSITNEEDVRLISADSTVIFTDGSKIEGRVGAAVSVWKNGAEKRHRLLSLASYCSVFQAELAAIRAAIEMIAKDNGGSKTRICSDARSALESIRNSNDLHPLVVEIRRILKDLKEPKNVEFFWIKAHAGIQGNERADELAKKAALTCKTAPVYDCFPIYSPNT